MAIREKLKKTFSRRKSSTDSDPSDKSSSLYYQPGERIPYKYRRPVEPAHKEKLDSFSFTKAWRRRSTASQYSPGGSRVTSRSNSVAGLPSSIWKRNSIDKNKRASLLSNSTNTADLGGTGLEPIESVPTTRMEPSNLADAPEQAFTQSELDAAMKRAKAVPQAKAS